MLVREVDARLDGKATIATLKAADYNWRQMEWIGFGFEYLAQQALYRDAEVQPGPSFGRTKFDVRRTKVWDLKAHPTNVGGPAILNDCEAVDKCAETYGGIGFILACGTAEYDESGEFKLWHDAMKGKTSDYERDRILRDAPSRRRKTSFSIERYDAYWFASTGEIKAAVAAGWFGYFAQGRNSDGSRRRPKYLLKDHVRARRSEALAATAVP